MSKSIVRWLPFILFITMVFFLWRGLSLSPRELPSVYINKPLPAITLDAYNGQQPVSLRDLKGRVVLLNVFASWCNACLEEQSMLLDMARQGVYIVGLNYKDSQDDLQHYLERFGSPYQKIGRDESGQAAIQLGVYGAPETFVMDKKGIVRFRYAGVITEAVWRSKLRPLIEQLEREA